MYFKTRTNVIEKCIKMVETVNEELDLNIGIRLDSENRSCGSLNCNTRFDAIREIVLNPNKFEDIEHNRLYVFTVLHEIGHALDIRNYHADVQSYFGNYRRNDFQYEIRAWEIGITWGIERGFISPVNFPNLKKYMEYCLESYATGNIDTKQVATQILASTKGGK